jgi:UPF0755 protein
MSEPHETGSTVSGASPTATIYPRAAPRSPGEALKPMLASPPPPPKKRKRMGFIASLSAALTVLLFGALAVLGGVVFVKRQLHEAGPLATDKIVVINKGDGVEEVGDTLKREGVITHPYVFMGAVVARGLRVKAGEYQFKAGATLNAVIETLVEGKAILHSVTIPEGLTSEQIVERLKDSDVLTGDVKDIPREGTLLPDTYKFQRGMSREQVLAVMAQAQKKVLAEIWARRTAESPIKSQQELVTLASIVEKETGKADERTRVAGVFLNRLQKRMRLQSDPTIVYGLVGGKGTLGRGILKTEIQTPTPYNTYTIDGLPPGPIANPGKAALEAVANPSRTRDLFFVADGTGGHVFAETYEQHLRNVSKWRQVESSRREKSSGVDRAEESDAVAPTGGAAGENTSGRESVVTPPAISQPVPALPQNVAPQNGGGNAVPSQGKLEPSRTDSVKPTPLLSTGESKPKLPDAVEGTSKDPLLNKTYDLNSPKTVPSLRP